MVELKTEQQAFLTECEQEFSKRYTLEDPDFNAVFNSDIPPPPIMNNWYPRNKRIHGGGGRYGGYRDRRNDRYNRPDHGRGYGRYEERDNYQRGHDRYEREKDADNCGDSYRDRGNRD